MTKAKYDPREDEKTDGLRNHADILRVTWWDASQHDDEDLQAVTLVGVVRYTVGYAVRDDDVGLVLAADLCDGIYTKGYTIPRPYVLDVAHLNPQD